MELSQGDKVSDLDIGLKLREKKSLIYEIHGY